MTLLTLPHELVERILLLLSAESVQTCRLVNRVLNDIIQSSALLQYFQACEVAGVIDNPQSPLSYAKRLEALKKREAAWRKLKPMFETTINFNNQTASRICRSTAGFFINDNNLKDLDCVRLPSSPQDNPKWIRIPCHGPVLNWSGILVNCVTAFYEHDLLVNFISSDSEHQEDMHSLDMVLLKFSTGEYHPLAHRPRIYVQTSSEVEPWVVARIVGDNLAFVVHSEGGTFSDKLFIFDWKTGRKLLQHEASQDTYSGLTFVSPELLLVPNRVLSHFEVWHLPPPQLNPKPPIQILSLSIPLVSPEYSIAHFSSLGEPNPFLHSMPYLPPRPFFSSTENSIIVTTIQMETLSNSRLYASYDLIMHRRALLDTIQKWTSPSLTEQRDIPTWWTNEVTVHRISEPEDGSVRLDAQPKLISATPRPRCSSRTRACRSPTSATFSTCLASNISTNSSTSQSTFFQVPWEKWGPPISRWFQVNEPQTWFLGYYSNGQRYAFSEPNPLGMRKLTVSVADFNPHNLRKNAEMKARLRGECENNSSNSNNEERKEEEEKGEFELLDHKGIFSEEVHMGLKCVVYRVPDEYGFDVVLMDEERLLGVKLNRDGWEESINVLYIG